MPMQSQHVLIELDALLDTRIGLLGGRFPSKLPTVDLTAYINRNKNNLAELFDLPEDEWQTAWEQRDLLAVRHAHATTLAKTVGRLLHGHKVRGDVSPIHDRLHVIVNVWPYRLTDEEEDAFVQAITELMVEGTLVSTERLSPKELTPSLIDDRFNALIMYDAVTWLDAQKEALASHRIPRVTLYTQGVLLDDNPETLDYIERESIDPFIRVKQQLAEYISIHWWKPGYFSLPELPSESPDPSP